MIVTIGCRDIINCKVTIVLCNGAQMSVKITSVPDRVFMSTWWECSLIPSLKAVAATLSAGKFARLRWCMHVVTPVILWFIFICHYIENKSIGMIGCRLIIIQNFVILYDYQTVRVKEPYLTMKFDMRYPDHSTSKPQWKCMPWFPVEISPFFVMYKHAK